MTYLVLVRVVIVRPSSVDEFLRQLLQLFGVDHLAILVHGFLLSILLVTIDAILLLSTVCGPIIAAVVV